MNTIRRASIETFERVKDVTSSRNPRDRRLSLTVMNCIWARNTELETLEPVQGEIIGTIPEWLDGTFYRVGPGVFQVGEHTFDHPFEMLSVLQKFDIEASSSKVTYRNKIVDSKLRSITERTQAMSSITKNQHSKDPFKLKLQSLRDRFGHRGKPGEHTIADNCNDNICFFGSDLYILSDISHMIKINNEDLETLSQCELEDYLPSILMASPHPQIEDNGTIWNIGTSYSKEEKSFSYTIFCLKNTESSIKRNSVLDSAEVLCRIPCRHRYSPAFYHSFGLSSNYILFIEQPLFYEDSGRSRQYIYENSDYKYQNLKWRPHEGVRFYIVNKLSGRVLPIQYTAISFFFFHLVNTFETNDGNLVVEVVAYENAEVLNELKFAKIEKTDRCPTAKLKRFVLPLTVDLTQVQNGDDLLYNNSCSVNIKSVSSTLKGIEMQLIPEDLVPETLEFPRINYEYSGKKYRYLYGLGNEYLHPNKILKIDTETRDVIIWKEPGHFVSEPVFVARNIGLSHDEMDEDDGVVLFTLLNTSPYNTVQLVILDGKSFKELARIKFLTLGEVVEGFHGIFVRRGSQIIRY